MMNDDAELMDLKQRTKDFALRVIRLFTKFPESKVAQVIGNQVLRSGTSVSAHYREASRARSMAEFVSKLGGGLQELDETEYWLELLVDAEIVPSGQLEDLLKETDELMAIFVTCIKNSKEKVDK
jgi:four helix bundle protein